jgi:pantoate--beta-alanine ligase
MEIHNTVKGLRDSLKKFKLKNQSIGFVPTMGFLHEGHFNLIEESKKANDITVVSIFVNPLQFNDIKDFEKYPKNEEGDIKNLTKLGVDILFLPSAEEVYGQIGEVKIEMKIPSLMKNLCAPSRPGHFEGVLHIVSKLFNYVLADKVYFGLKDYQQFLIIKELINNLSFPVEIIGVETVREKSGLAMSSRNSRLSKEESEEATLVYRSMKMAEKNSSKKNITILTLKDIIKEILLSSKMIKIDYIEILDPDTLENKEYVSGKILIAIAVFMGNVRLIDNIRFEV